MGLHLVHTCAKVLHSSVFVFGFMFNLVSLAVSLVRVVSHSQLRSNRIRHGVIACL